MTRIQSRRDTAANWAAGNPILAVGQIGVDLTNHQIRVGDGGTAWLGLPTYSDDAAANATYVPVIPLTGKSKSTSVARLQAALSTRDVAPLDILVIGDSITEGAGASQYAFRYVSKLREALRAAFPTPGIGSGGGVNYRTAFPEQGSIPKNPPGSFTADARYGFGKRSIQLVGGTNLVFTERATSFKISWYQDTGTGSFTYSVDGGAPVTVNTVGAHSGETLTTITGLAEGVHTLTLAWVSGFVEINGIQVYCRDEASGIRIWESGHFGYKSSDFLAGISGGGPQDWMQSITNVQPHHVIIELGANDALTDSAATFQGNLATLMAAVRSHITTSPGFTLVAVGERQDTLVEPWANYVAKMTGMASSDGGIDVVDMTKVIPKSTGGGDLWWYDGVHPSDYGHKLIGQAIADFITP